MAQSFRSAVTANLGFQVLAGNCLAMAQGITGAPVNHPSATAAANATRFRHYDRNVPNAMCVLWFDHWGAYGEPGREVYANWGHVVVFVPGYGYASSSPIGGEVSTPYYYDTITDVERAFNCSFRFWSEDINGHRVCQEETVMDAEIRAEFKALREEIREARADVRAVPTRVLSRKLKNKAGKISSLATLVRREANASDAQKKRNVRETARWAKLWTLLLSKPETPAKGKGE